jgi:hypothetical protein
MIIDNNISRSIFCKVLSVVHEGHEKADSCVFLVVDAKGVRFEAWLSYSTAAVNQGKLVNVGDDVILSGKFLDPIRSHRTHGGLHLFLNEIRFFKVLEVSRCADMSEIELRRYL